MAIKQCCHYGCWRALWTPRGGLMGTSNDLEALQSSMNDYYHKHALYRTEPAIKRPTPYLPIGLCWDWSNDTRFLSLDEMRPQEVSLNVWGGSGKNSIPPPQDLNVNSPYVHVAVTQPITRWIWSISECNLLRWFIETQTVFQQDPWILLGGIAHHKPTPQNMCHTHSWPQQFS